MGWSQDTWASTHVSPGSLLASWGPLCEVTTRPHAALKGPGHCPAACKEKLWGAGPGASPSQQWLSPRRHLISLTSLLSIMKIGLASPGPWGESQLRELKPCAIECLRLVPKTEYAVLTVYPPAPFSTQRHQIERLWSQTALPLPGCVTLDKWLHPSLLQFPRL